MKRLIVCCDGTWNTPTQEENGLPCPTNVFKISRAIADDDAGTAQLKYYHTGVGAEGGAVDKLLDGAFAYSLDEHIQSAYAWLGANYAEGDEIYLFGFSRGAFTVRSLAGMIGIAGLLKLAPAGSAQPPDWEAVKAAYLAYLADDAKLTAAFKQKYHGRLFNNGQAVEIRLVGVWDTVGAVGIPRDVELLDAITEARSRAKLDSDKGCGFHSSELGSHVLSGRHAMALDEIRATFTVARWTNAASHGDVVELWFPGVHSDVGGGYQECALSDVALEWMIGEAAQLGLKFRPILNQLRPDALAPKHQSYKGVFAALRSRPRNAPMLAAAAAEVHPAVITRQAAGLIGEWPYWPTSRLAVGQSWEGDIFAVEHWNATGVYMQAGDQYVFSASGTWVDKDDVCDWRGAEGDRHFTPGDVARAIGSLCGRLEHLFDKDAAQAEALGAKRFEPAPWFSMVGAISNDSGRKPAVGDDGIPVPHTYVSLPNYQVGAQPLKIDNPGYFYAFTNDAWSFYANNKGSIRLRIQRVA